MLAPKMRSNILKYQKTHFVLGVTKEKSNVSKHKVGIGDTLSLQHQNKQLKSKLSTLEYPQKNKKTTLVDKQNILKINTQPTQSSQTLEAVSILKEKDSKQYWRGFSKEISQKLWLPTETDSPDLDTLYLNGFLNNTKQSSFVITKKQLNQKMSYQKTLCLSSQFLPQDTTEKENIKKIQYCRKIRFYPSKEFKLLAEKCFGATRYLINKAIEGIVNKTITNPTNHISLRNAVLKSKEQLLLPENKEEKWLMDVPYDTRQLCLKQLASNYKTGFTQHKNKTIDKFEMKYKSKRNPYQYFFVDKRAFKPSQLKIFTKKIKSPFKLRKKQEKWWNKNILNSTQNIIIRREKNKYYIHIPRKKEGWNSGRFKFEHKHNCVALDPGVRTFQTIYSEEGIAGKIGHNMCEDLIDIGLKVDKLKSFLDTNKIKKKTRYNIKKRCFLLRTKIKNKVNDLHWKTANYLCSTFKHIFLPNFETSNMVRKDLPKRARVINSKTVRNMLSLSHYKFKERLLYLCTHYGSKVHLCGEHYTTRACGGCGVLNKVEGSKVYNCNYCKFKMDRDYNGSRNIYMDQMK